jgi:hypothetical protein
MKAFQFQLERVRAWREKQLAIEEAQLERLFAEKALTEERRRLLDREAHDSQSAVCVAKFIEAPQLHALDAFRHFAAQQHKTLTQSLLVCDHRIAQQQQRILEARRRLELLNKLKERQLKTWTANLARELELQAGEIYLAKWSRNGPD